MPRAPKPERDASGCLIAIISVLTVIAMLAGWAHYGKPVDAEQAWRDRVGR